MKKYLKRKPNIMTMAGVVLITLSLSLLILLALFKVPRLQDWYERYLIYLTELEIRIASFDSKWIIILSLFVLFSIKALMPLPILPLSCVFVISSMVFMTPIALLINTIGLILIFSIRYYIGTKRKAIPYKILKSYDEIWNILEHDGNGNPWLLFVCRFIPMFPINTVSNIYGSMRYDFKNYLIISTFAFMPKLISYLIIGRNLFNPFSAPFLVPITVLFLLAGIGLLLTRRVILVIKGKVK